jgi:carnitine 3-dehydrogenase
MRHMLEQFGPCLKWPWTKLEAPELTTELIDRMVTGTQEQAQGRSIRELERLRDEYLVAIQQVLRQSNIGAGGTLRALEQRLYADHARGAAAPAATGAGLPPLRGEVRPEWIDYNGHMTDSRYQQVFGDVMDALCRRIGIDESYRQRVGMYYTVESHTTHGVELKVGDPYEVRTRILAVDDKRLRLFHALHRTRDGALVATGEQMHLHVGVKAGKTVPVADAIRVQLERFRDAQAKEPLPPQAGRAIGQAPKG